MAAISQLKVQETIERLLDLIGQEGLETARRAIRSAALKAAIRFEKVSYRWGRLVVPHYWAIYQHDGRGPVFPVKARLLVWFVDPSDDPRLPAGRYPVRLSEVRRLTPDEFAEGMQKNKELFQANPSGGPQQFMRVVQHSGPTRPGKSYPFFEKGMTSFPAAVRRIAENFLRDEAAKLAIRERDSVTLRL